MRNKYIIIIVSLLMMGSLTPHESARAHGNEEHGKMMPADAQMKKLHAIMPMFSVTSAALKTALEKGDAKTIELEAGKIIAAFPDLKKSKPHKNINQKKKFVEMANKLETSMTSTMYLVKKGNFAGAKGAFKKAEETCAACPATFRD